MIGRINAPTHVMLLLTLLVLPALLYSSPTMAAARCFPETGLCLDGRIRTY